jgi:adenosylcobinamide-GDP ribazoletransferase
MSCPKELQRLFGSLLFYSRLPLPSSWSVCFEGIARYAPVVGLLLGGILALGDWGLGLLGLPLLNRSLLVVLGGLWLTGGLHLDGAMDTADGLAVVDPQRRLAVMADSRSGAFGVMGAIALLLLKVVALTALPTFRWAILLGVLGWARWAQVWAVVRYPYLKPEGKGAIHRATMRGRVDLLPGLVALGGLSGGLIVGQSWKLGLVLGLLGPLLAIGVARWFNQRLGGQTGDSYGAIVEWSEAGLLTGLSVLSVAVGFC